MAGFTGPMRGKPTGVSADLMRPPRRWTNILMLSVVSTVVATIAWAGWASIDEVTPGTGQVIPAGKVKVVQNLEGGIVSDLKIKEGDQVAKGDLLLRIDPTGSGSRLNESLERQAGMRAGIARLRAEAHGAEPEFPQDLVAGRPDLIGREKALYESRRNELGAALSGLDEQIRQRKQEVDEIKSQVAVLSRGLSLAQEELELTRPAVKEGVVSRVELIRTEGRVNELAGKLSAAQLSLPRAEAALAEAKQKRLERERKFRSDALSELNKTEVELAALAQVVKAQQDRVARTEVRSPVDGIVKQVNVTTIGQVVQPGQDLVEVVPIDPSLLIEAKVRPSDIAFLRPRERAIVKITAYDYTVYGTLPGTLERIGADTVQDDEGHLFYQIQVRTDRNYLGTEDDKYPILPGMVAQVDVVTGKKTVLQYLVAPVLRLREEALHER